MGQPRGEVDDVLLKIVGPVITCVLGIAFFVLSGCFHRKPGKREAKREEKAPFGERFRNGRGAELNWGIVLAVVLAVMLITIAAGAAMYFHEEKKENSGIPAPTLPGTVGSMDDLSAKKQAIDIWALLQDGPYSGTGTKAEMLDSEIQTIRTMLDPARKDREYFGFPEKFQLHPVPSENVVTERTTASSLEEYDKQLADAVPKEEYYWTANIALSCLQMCKNTGNTAEYEYYCQLAVWGLVNWYVSLGENASSKQLVDLFYWIGQAYDYLGGAMTGDAKQGPFFVSAAFLEMAAQELLENGFQGNTVDADTCWSFYLVMLERLDEHMDAGTGYGARADAQRALHPVTGES